MNKDNLGNKLPGKTKFSGTRRTTTRTSGYKSHADSTGGELKIEKVKATVVPKGQSIVIEFTFQNHKPDDIVAFGGWYASDENMEVSIEKGIFPKESHSNPETENWSKFGSMTRSQALANTKTKVTFKAIDNTYLALYKVQCGIVHHEYLDWAKAEKPVLLKNMYQFAPESNFYSEEGNTSIKMDFDDNKSIDIEIYLKKCNRCARFLPININNERHHLSFSNHCVAEHRRPCSHTGFGKLKNIENDDILYLEYGYQLECRFCKKFEVNAAHNPQRTSAQMKEDGARRRYFELLLTEIFDQSVQLSYRTKTGGNELADDIWNKFERKCFNCDIPLATSQDMHLDHTRPLALLWPLDETATCLCNSCNSQKRDRPPSEFYTAVKLRNLSNITGIPYEDISNPTPNTRAVELIINKIEWLMNDFCQKPELQKFRDGKLTAELLLKALQKTINRTIYGKDYDLIEIYQERNIIKS